MSEVISEPLDKNVNGLPRHTKARASGKRARPPILWKVRQTASFDEGETWGQYPRGFLDWAYRELRLESSEVLHVCSGALLPSAGTRVDLRRSVSPDVVADGRALPFTNVSFDAVLIDPPYTIEYARDLYGQEYPRPSHLLREAARVVRPGGVIAILHFLQPRAVKPLRFETVYGITQGAGYRIRAFTVYRRRDGP